VVVVALISEFALAGFYEVLARRCFIVGMNGTMSYFRKVLRERVTGLSQLTLAMSVLTKFFEGTLLISSLKIVLAQGCFELLLFLFKPFLFFLESFLVIPGCGKMVRAIFAYNFFKINRSSLSIKFLSIVKVCFLRFLNGLISVLLVGFNFRFLKVLARIIESISI